LAARTTQLGSGGRIIHKFLGRMGLSIQHASALPLEGGPKLKLTRLTPEGHGSESLRFYLPRKPHEER
jgi:hypothetical protein